MSSQLPSGSDDLESSGPPEVRIDYLIVRTSPVLFGKNGGGHLNIGVGLPRSAQRGANRGPTSAGSRKKRKRLRVENEGTHVAVNRFRTFSTSAASTGPSSASS